MISNEAKQDANITGISACCGAEIVNGFCSDCLEHADPCEFCLGTGFVEITEVVMDNNDPATRRTEGTGKYKRCPEGCGDGDETPDEN